MFFPPYSPLSAPSSFCAAALEESTVRFMFTMIMPSRMLRVMVRSVLPVSYTHLVLLHTGFFVALLLRMTVTLSF